MSFHPTSATDVAKPEASECNTDPGQTWKVMLVDDDAPVHQVTKLALRRFRFQNQRLSFLSAYSGEEAIELINTHPDTALILLDIVMETNDAGLKVVEYIRNTLGNDLVQIIVRTGQPGEAPEESVVLNYPINDYRTKLELTQQKLFTAIITGLRAYHTLQRLSSAAASYSPSP